jgi:hypothetical protein
MAFRLTVEQRADLKTVRLAGRLGDDAVTPVNEACERSGQPIVLDLSEVTGASDAGVVLLHRLTREGVHLLGASQYMTLLLNAEKPPAAARPRRDRQRAAGRRARPGHGKGGPS